MNKTELNFEPHSDTGIEQLETIQKHKNLISNNKLSDATALLDNENYQLGVRASLLNYIQNKIRKFQLYFLNEYIADDDEYYSSTEPDVDFMKENGYQHWIKPW